MTAQSNITPKVSLPICVICNCFHAASPTIAAASTEIINLEAILNLLKEPNTF